MTLFKEFKTFISRGNVIDMAVGIIIGASFTKIVDALVNDLLMPPIGLLLGGADFSDLQIILKKGTETTPAVTLGYGLLINALVNFLIIAISVFILIKALSFIYKKEKPSQRHCPHCCMEIPHQAARCGHCTSPL